MGEPRKAYRVEVRGEATKYLLIWANTVDEANEIAEDQRGREDCVVLDTHYGEVGVVRGATRRLPSEDRDDA